MSGRHRKPTNSSFSVAKIAVTGAVIGGGTIGLAAQAQAASDSEWDVVAACESSGNWAINTGNGYQGGLQFAPSTWLGYGGGDFASAAHLASRDEQIAIAEKVLAGQGRGAWPTCGRGLSGPTPRDVISISTETIVETPDETPVAAAATPADAPADAPIVPLDNPLPEIPPVPQDAPVPADLAPVAAPENAPAPDAAPPAPEAPAPVPIDGPAPLPAQDAPEDLPDPTAQVEIITISETVVPAQDPAVNIVQASLSGPAPLAPADPATAPADPALPPADPALPPADPALLPADPAVEAVVPIVVSTDPAVAPTAAPAPAPAGEAIIAAPLPEGVSHLPSPDSPPPGTSTDPGSAAGNPNVSYLRDLWHAVQNDEIDRNDLLLALAQRSFTGPIPADATTPAAVVPPAPVPPPAG